MSVSTLESENAQPVAQTQNSELIYRLEDRPPLPQTLFAACQHLLAMFVAVITPAHIRPPSQSPVRPRANMGYVDG